MNEEEQKIIDELITSAEEIVSKRWVADQLKSLLEKVAREQEILTQNALGWPSDDSNSLLVTKYLTFNED